MPRCYPRRVNLLLLREPTSCDLPPPGGECQCLHGGRGRPQPRDVDPVRAARGCRYSEVHVYSVLHVAAGDDLGKIWVYDVGEQLAVPQADEWNKFAHTLQVSE